MYEGRHGYYRKREFVFGTWACQKQVRKGGGGYHRGCFYSGSGEGGVQYSPKTKELITYGNAPISPNDPYLIAMIAKLSPSNCAH